MVVAPVVWGLILAARCNSSVVTPQATPHRFFSSSAQRDSVNSPDTTTNYGTISAFHQHLGQNTMAQTTHTHSVNIGDNNDRCGNIIGSFNNTFYKSDEDAQIMRWLSPLEPNNRHQSVRTSRFGGVGDWLLETSEFREWRGGEGEADRAVLFCSGNPGVGKTYLR